MPNDPTWEDTTSSEPSWDETSAVQTLEPPQPSGALGTRFRPSVKGFSGPPSQSILGISPESIPSGAGTKAPWVTIPLSVAGKTAAGVAGYLTSPQGATETALAATPAAPVIFAKWAYDMVRGGYQSTKAIVDELGQMANEAFNKGIISANQLGPVPEGKTTQEHIQSLAENAANAALMSVGGVASGLHAAKGVIRNVPRGAILPESIVPAIRKIGGEIVPGEQGQTHPEIIKEEKIPATEIDQRGFSDPQGKVFLDREAAAQGTQAPTEFEEGRLHSTDLAKAQEEPPTAPTEGAPPTAPETVTAKEVSPVAAGSPEPAITEPKPVEPVGQAVSVTPPVTEKVKPAATKRVAKSSGSIARFHRETELNGPDILSWMQENIKMLSARGARLKWGRAKFRENQSLYDDIPKLQRTHHNIVFSPEGSTPDTVAQAAYRDGLLREPSVNELAAAMDSASKKRANVFKQAKVEEQFLKDEAEQHTQWLKATAEGETRINADDLKPGDFLEVEGEQIAVKSVDADGNVTLENGKKFGIQVLGEGQKIHVEKFSPAEEAGVEFGTEPQPVPTLRPMEKSGELFQGKEQPFNLAGERVIDAERIAREKALQEAKAAEVKAAESKLQPMLGMGGAVKEEFTPLAGTPTSIKNAVVDQERIKRGLPPAIQPLKRSFGEVWDRAMAMIDHDPYVTDNLLDSLRAKPKALDDFEDALLLQRQVDLQNDYAKATRDLAQAFEDGRTAAADSEKIRVARLSDQLLDLYNIEKTSGTATARGLNARKMLANEDFTLAKMEMDLRGAKGGAPLTDSQRAEMQQLHDRIAATQKAYDDYRATSEARLSEAKAKQAMAEAIAKAAPTFDKRVLAAAESIVKRMEIAAKPAAYRLRERLSRMSAGVDPTIVYDAAIVGSAKIARLGLDLAKFTDEMVRDFGEKLRPMIPEIWTQANKIIEESVKFAPEPVRRVVKKATLTETKTEVAQQIADKVAKGQKDKISWYVQKLAREMVKNGITDREILINEVHKVLEDAIPGITRREAMDAISGYGDYRQLSKDAITVQLRGMKGEMQQLAKLEDMAKGEPPLKSGLERRTRTEAERKLIKEVNDAKNRFQVPVRDPETQLKSALDTLKTTLQNRITDYEDRIARKDFSTRPRRELVLDEEAMRLKAQAERVKTQFRRMVARNRMAHMSTGERAIEMAKRLRRFEVLSGINSIRKLASFSLQKIIGIPIEEAYGSLLFKAPILKDVALKSSDVGFNLGNEIRYIKEGFTKGIRDAGVVRKHGESDLGELYDPKINKDVEWTGFFGRLHQMEKSPLIRISFERAKDRLTDYYASRNVDVSSEPVQTRIAVEAYQRALEEALVNRNWISSRVNRFLDSLAEKDKATGKPRALGQAAKLAIELKVPIRNVPLNYISRTLEYVVGSVTGSYKLAKALGGGMENLTEAEANAIKRHLVKGSIGGAVMALGYFNPQMFGGYYQPGEKRKPGQVKASRILINGWQVPSVLIHNPLVEVAQFGATIRRVADSKLRKKDTEAQGLGSGAMAALLGLIDEAPYIRGMLDYNRLRDPRQRDRIIGDEVRSLLVPQLIQNLAQFQDKDVRGEIRQRRPQTIVQNIKTGIPYLRQQVPLATRQP